MMQTIRPYLRMLPLAQQRLWFALRPAAQMGFVLYEETAVVLRLGHKASVELPTCAFEFYTNLPLNKQAIFRAMPFVARSTVLKNTENVLSVLTTGDGLDDTSDCVRVSFYGNAAFGRVAEPSYTEDGVLQIASMEDLLAFKFKSLLQRTEARDYKDILTLLDSGVTLSDGLAASRSIFGTSFQVLECLKSMTYFDEGDLATLSLSEKRFLRKKARAIRTLTKYPLESESLALPPITVATEHEAERTVASGNGWDSSWSTALSMTVFSTELNTSYSYQ